MAGNLAWCRGLAAAFVGHRTDRMQGFSDACGMHPQHPTAGNGPPDRGSGRFVPATTRAGLAFDLPTPRDCDFIDLLNAYRPHGGLTRLSTLPEKKRIHCNGRDWRFDDLVFQEEVFAFAWQDAIWLPMFQFNVDGLAVGSAAQSVVSRLGFGSNGWAIASWFVAPNGWLENHQPVECLNSRLSDVLYAARADSA